MLVLLAYGQNSENKDLNSFCLSLRFQLDLYIVSTVFYMSTPVSQFIPSRCHPPWYLYVYSLHLCLHFCIANKIIYTNFFRFHIYALIYDICFSLSDLLRLCTTASRSIHVSTISFLFIKDADFEDFSDKVTSCRMLALPEAGGGKDQLLSYIL